MRIILDAMGSDNFPEPEIHASMEAAEAFGDTILLVGKKELLQPQLDAMGASDKVSVVHAPEVL